MVNPESANNDYRIDPYKNYRFCVKWDGKYVAGISHVNGLKRTTNVIKHRDGGDPSGQPCSAVTLEQGVTHADEFVHWVNKVWDYSHPATDEGPAEQMVSLKDFRKDIIIELYNEAGQKDMAYNLFRCWVSECQFLPELDANGGAIAIQSIRLEYESMQRDPSVLATDEARIILPE